MRSITAAGAFGSFSPARQSTGTRDAAEVGALVEIDKAAHRGAIGLGRHGGHDLDGARASRRIGRRPDHGFTMPGASSAMVLPASSGPSLSATNFVWNSPSALPKAGLVQASTAAA